MRTITANVSCKGLFCIQEIEEYTAQPTNPVDEGLAR